MPSAAARVIINIRTGHVTTTDARGWPFYGYATNGTSRAWHYYDGSNDNWNLYNNGIRMTVGGDGDVGIGTSSPSAKLNVVTSTTRGV